MKERIKDQGTFAVSTNESFSRLPTKTATSFRVTNLTGKILGIRQRHSVHVVEDFENGFDGWEIRSGTLKEEPAINLEGAESAILDGVIAKQLPTINDECIVQVKFWAYDDVFKIGVFDTLDRVDLISSGTAGSTVNFENGSISTSAPSSSSVGFQVKKDYILTLEFHPSKELFTAELSDGATTQVIAQGVDSTNDASGGGVIGDGENYFLGIQGTNLIIDEILFLRKESYPNEMLTSGSSYTFDCISNLNEYEIVNLGSDARNYGDNTETVTATGYYSK